MKITPILHSLALSSVAVAAFWAIAPSAHASLVLDLQSANYNASTGVWDDASASNNDAVANNTSYIVPKLAGATPNGSAALDFSVNPHPASTDTGTSDYYYLKLTNTLNSASFTSSPNFTLTFVVDLSRIYSNESLFGRAGGSTLSLVLGTGTNIPVAIDYSVSTWAGSGSGWGIITATYDGTTAKVYYNGNLLSSSVKTVTKTFTTPTTSYIGHDAGTANSFSGQLAAVKIYDTALSASEISADVASLTALYFDPVPEPATWAMMVGGLGVLALGWRMRLHPR